MVFVTISSLSSGLLLNPSGWHAVNYGSLPFLALATLATLWLMGQRRPARHAAGTKRAAGHAVTPVNPQ